jgi:hypothetical protein
MRRTTAAVFSFAMMLAAGNICYGEGLGSFIKSKSAVPAAVPKDAAPAAAARPSKQEMISTINGKLAQIKASCGEQVNGQAFYKRACTDKFVPPMKAKALAAFPSYGSNIQGFSLQSCDANGSGLYPASCVDGKVKSIISLLSMFG